MNKVYVLVSIDNRFLGVYSTLAKAKEEKLFEEKLLSGRGVVILIEELKE